MPNQIVGNSNIKNVSFENNEQLNSSNASIKNRVDTLIEQINTQTSAINSLQTSMKDTAVTTRKTINSADDIRGKNIFLAQPIEVGNILDYLAPYGIREYLSRDFRPIIREEPLSLTDMEAEIYMAANRSRTSVGENVYISMNTKVPLSSITSNMGGFLSEVTYPRIYASPNKLLESNMRINNYTYYQLTEDTWRVNSDNNINFISLGNNGQIYIGNLEENDLKTSVATASKEKHPNVNQYLINKYINDGSRPVNKDSLQSLNSNKAVLENILNIHNLSITKAQNMIKIFQSAKSASEAQISQAKSLIASTKADIASEQQKIKNIQNEGRNIFKGVTFSNFWSKVEEFIKYIEKIESDLEKEEQDIDKVAAYNEEVLRDQEAIESDNEAIAYLGNAIQRLRASQSSTQTLINTTNDAIHKAENPPHVMALQNFNSNHTTPTQNSQHSQEFLTGYTNPIEYLGCYRDGGDRGVANFRGNYPYEMCATKAIENGDNIFSLQYGGSSGTTPQCFSDLQTGPDYTAAIKHPGSTTEIQHSTQSSYIQPKEYTCVTDANNPNIHYGGAWTNATYLVQPGYATTLKLIGLSDQTSDFPAGSLVMDLKNAHSSSGASISGYPKVIRKAPANSFISNKHLLSFPENELEYRANQEINSASPFNNFIGADGNLVRSLYSADFKFKLAINGQEPPSIKICINTDASGTDIASKRASFAPIQTFVTDLAPLNQNRNLNTIYYLDLDVNNYSLGNLGFINYDAENSAGLGTSSNPYKITFYNNGGSGVLNPSREQDKQFEFLRLRGSLKSTDNLTLQKPDDILDINECKQYCYGNSNTCTAWQYNEFEVGNKCLISTQTNLNDILMSSAWSSARGSKTEFNIRMPTNQGVPSGCPPFNKANVIVARIPILVKNSSPPMYTTTAINTSSSSEFYYTIDTSGKEPSCNVTKEFGSDLSTLNSLKETRQGFVEELDSLLRKMNAAEQEMYRKLLDKQTELNTNVGEYKTLKNNLDYLNNESDINITMNAALDDTMLQLVDNSYEYILWTILAVLVVIIAINLAKK